MHSGRATLKPRLFYEKQARDLLKNLREDKELTYDQLAQRLRAHGAVLETRPLINKINRGRFTFAFALQVLAAMDQTTLRVPNALGPDRAKPSSVGGWMAPKDPRRSRKTPAKPAEGAGDDPEDFE